LPEKRGVKSRFDKAHSDEVETGSSKECALKQELEAPT
jgi:hypothetical protein